MRESFDWFASAQASRRATPCAKLLRAHRWESLDSVARWHRVSVQPAPHRRTNPAPPPVRRAQAVCDGVAKFGKPREGGFFDNGFVRFTGRISFLRAYK